MKYALLAAFCIGVLGGCDRPHSEEAARASDKKTEPPQIAQTVELQAAKGARTLNGVATIINPDTLLQIDADLRSATLSANFSRGTATRYKSANSLSRQTVETAERQAGTDGTQQKLLETRLRHTWGDTAPFLEAESRQKLIAGLSAGTDAIVRMDFPELTGGTPRNVRVAPLSGGDGTPVKTLWPAPSGNQSMPGVSYFGLIDAGPGLRPGDRARLIADGSETQTGVIIPNAAIIVYAGQSWCYLETAPNKFERRAVALELPLEDGYLVNSGFAAGMRVVVRGASLLLSREAAPDDDDSDDGAAKKPAKTDEKRDSQTNQNKPSGSSEEKTQDPSAENQPADKTQDTSGKANHSRAAVTAKNAQSPASRSDPD